MRHALLFRRRHSAATGSPSAAGRGAAKPWSALLLVAAMMASCGGGGQGDAPAPLEVPLGLRVETASAGSDLSVGQMPLQGAALAHAVMFTTGHPMASVAVSPQAASVGRLATAGGDLLRHALAPGRASWSRINTLGPQVVTEPCLVRGALRISVDDTDGNQRWSAGDRIALQATDCVTAPDAPILQGLFALTLERVDMDDSGQVNALLASGSMVGFAVGSSATMDGGFKLWLRNETDFAQRLRIRYEDMLVRRTGQGTLLFDFDVLTLASSREVLHTLSGGLVIDGLTYRLEPVDGAPLVLTLGGGLPGSFYEPPSDVWPRSGALRLLDAAGDALVLRARPGALLDLEFTPAGASVPTASLLSQPWSRYLQPPG